jgi:hypothetical protein
MHSLYKCNTETLRVHHELLATIEPTHLEILSLPPQSPGVSRQESQVGDQDETQHHRHGYTLRLEGAHYLGGLYTTFELVDSSPLLYQGRIATLLLPVA